MPSCTAVMASVTPAHDDIGELANAVHNDRDDDQDGVDVDEDSMMMTTTTTTISQRRWQN